MYDHSVFMCPKGMLQLPKEESLTLTLEDLLGTQAYVHSCNMSCINRG